MDKHTHKFQMEGNTYACFGWDGACGLRAPACFVPKAEALTDKGKADLFLTQHVVFVTVP